MKELLTKIKIGKSSNSVHKKVAQGLLWVSFIYVILCAFVCLLLWGILAMAGHIK
jgi:hypothetical protein